mgnify:CR=1 FL=1
MDDLAQKLNDLLSSPDSMEKIQSAMAAMGLDGDGGGDDGGASPDEGMADTIQSLLAGNWLGAILPVVALLNFLVFIWPAIDAFIRQQKYRHNPQTVNFKKAVRQQQQQRGYHHKCAVCGRTDTDYPDLQFRYCSKCAGYRCFCQDHIFSHVHFTEEDQ